MFFEDDFAKFERRLFNEFCNTECAPNEYPSQDNIKTFVMLAAKAGYGLDNLLELTRTLGLSAMADIVFAKINATRKPPGSTDGNNSE